MSPSRVQRRSRLWGRLTLPALLALGLTAPAVLADDILEGHARRGAVYQRLTMEDLTPQACAALCAGDGQCQS